MKYRIRSGELDRRLDASEQAKPIALARVAIVHQLRLAQPVRLAEVIEVSGGRFVGDQTVYIGTRRLLADMGATTLDAAINAIADAMPY